MMEEKRRTELEWLKNRLKNISTSNRTLCLARLPRNRVFSLSALDEYEPFKSCEIITNLISGTKDFRLAPVSVPQEQFTDSGEPPPITQISRCLTTLFRENESLIRNRGDAFFHLGFPFLEFYTKDDNFFRAPLFLFPCSLKKEAVASKVKKITWVIEIEAEPSLNELIYDAIEKGNGFKFDEDKLAGLKDLCDSEGPESLINKTLDFFRKSDFVVEGGLKKDNFYKDKGGFILKEKEYEEKIKNQEIKPQEFSKISYFVSNPITQINKDEIPPKTNLNLKFFSYCVIGQFPTYSSTLIKDYEEYLNNIQSMSDPIVDQIILGDCSDQENINPITEEDLQSAINVQENDRFFVLPANSTQEQIVLALRDLKQSGFVADGPPGTGKSQLIVNLLADNLAKGKKVLVVCEKRAALDVVYKRLQGTELRDHVLLIHSPEKERGKIFQTILDSIGKGEGLNNRKMKTSMQRFESLAEDIDEDIRYLNEYSEELHKERENGLSLFNMYSRALAKDTKLKLIPELCEKYASKQFDSLIGRFRKMFGDAQKYHSLKIPSSVKIGDSIKSFQISSIIEAIANLRESFKLFINQKNNLERYRFKDEVGIEIIERKKNILSEGLSSLRKLEQNDLVFMLMRRKVSIGQVEENLSILKSSIGHLPSEFRELAISHDTVEQDCETVSNYKSLLSEVSNKIYSPFQLFKKLSFETGNRELFSKLTRYRLTPLLQEDVIEVCKYIESNKDLIRMLAEGPDFPVYLKHKEEIERFQASIKIECVLPQSLAMAVWEGISQKINFLKSLQKSPFRFFSPRWHQTKKELDGFLKKNLSLTLDSLAAVEELIHSNISYLALKQYLKPLHLDLEITDLFNIHKMYQAIESFKIVIRSLEALFQLHDTYYEFLQSKGISSIPDAQFKFLALTRKYGIADDVKPEHILRDLFASQTIQKNKPYFRFFEKLEGFPKPMIAGSLNRFVLNLESQLDVYKKLAVTEDDFGIPPATKQNVYSVLSNCLNSYDDLIIYLQLKDRFVNDLKNVQNNFTLETRKLLENAVEDEDVFVSILDNIEYYLKNYEAERQWLDLSANLNEIERTTLMQLCELKSDDPFEEMDISYCRYWINKLEDEIRKIRSFTQAIYDSKREDLDSKLKEKREVAAEMISFLIKKNSSHVSHDSQLIHDLRLKRRKKSVRYVFKKYFNEIQKVFPVVLMAPENVSLCLPNKTDLFNLVIFDEASQLEVYKAIPSAFRGEAIFVTGDEHQLPPNRIGMTLYDDSTLPENYDPDNFDLQERLDSRAAESFLDQCTSRFCKYHSEASKRSGRKMLDWHYRSEHEALINFSNHAFYKGLIQVSPDPGQYRDYRCIKYHKVNGYFIKRRNIIESKEVVRLLKDFWLSRDKKIPTIGVVTFSLEQQHAIWDEIDRECVSNPAFAEVHQTQLSRKEGEEDVGFFIRNIENVQGDERDIIIFSIGYAPEAPGEKIEMQFGIFSREKGENRLNVAITRAKKEVHIVSSIEPEELRTEHTSHRGPKLLQEYLRYCRLIDQSRPTEAKKLLSGLSSLSIPDQESVLAFDSPFEQEVYHFLKSRGYIAKSQVGCSKYRIDLAVIDPQYSGRYLCGIECDGATYHSGLDARERDIYRQSFLVSKNWKILRIWSSQWFRYPEDAKNKLINAINELEQQSKNRPEASKESMTFKKEEMDSKIKNQPTSNKFNRCPECGSDFKVATNGYAYKLYCKTCHWGKVAEPEDLLFFVEDDKFCKYHPSVKLKSKKTIRGLFLSCPSCQYIEGIKIKEEFVHK